MYNVVETTNLIGSKCFDMQATTDIENGSIVAKGDLVTEEKAIYTASVPTDTSPVYLVANPAWSYNNNSITDQNEENYINKNGIPFRTYSLSKDMKFKVLDYGITQIDEDTEIAVGQYVAANGTTYKLQAVATLPTTKAFVGKIIDIEEIGFPYCVGSYGTSVTVGSEGMGYAIDTRVRKVTIEVVKNA